MPALTTALTKGQGLAAGCFRVALRHQQDRGGAIGEGTGVAGRDGSGRRSVECRAQPRQLLDTGIAPDEAIPRDPVQGRDLGGEPPILGGGEGIVMAAAGERVLIATADGPLLDHDLAVARPC